MRHFLFLLFAISLPVQAELQWEPAFPRPNGVYLIDEASAEPMSFYIDHKDEKIRIGGKLAKYTFADDLASATVYAHKMFIKGAFAGLQILDRASSARFRCRTSVTKEELRYLSKLPKGTQLIFEGKLTDFGKGLFTMEDCSVTAEVNLFHDSDKSIILGSWCHEYKGKTYWIKTFYRDENGQYHKHTVYENGYVNDDVIDLKRKGNKFRVEGGGGYIRDNHILYDPFSLSKSFSTLSRPDGTMARCKRVESAR